MKVLLVHPKVPIYGGAEKEIVRFCEYMRSHDIEHALAMPNIPDKMLADLYDTETPIVSFSTHTHYDFINYFNFPATLYSMFSNRPGAWKLGEPAEMFTNWKRKPIEWLNRKLVKHKIKNVIVNDEFNAKRCFDIYGVKPTVIYPGCDYGFFSQAEHRPDPKYFTVLQVGTISDYKNQLETVFAVGHSEIPNIRLWLNGYVTEPEYKTKIIQYARHLGVSVEWFSGLSQEKLRELYSQADVLMHPVKTQGGWLVPFEAMSVGVPIMVSPNLTCADIIINNHLGFVAGVISGGYVKGLNDVFQNRNIYNEQALKAKQWVSQNLSWEKHGENTIKYFERILNQ